MVRAVEDVEEALARKQVERLEPAGIQVDDACIGVDVEYALHSVPLRQSNTIGEGKG